MLRIALFVTVLVAPGLALAKDCTPVETAPGVKTRPAGCNTIIKEPTPKKADDGRLRSSDDGWIHYRDGTRVRVFGRVETDVGVSH